MKMTMLKNAMMASGKVAIKAGMKLRKASPEIMLAGGIAAGIGAVVMACAATKKIIEDKVSEQTHEELNDIQKIEDVRERKHEAFRTYGHLVWVYCKAYGWAAFLLILSVGLILGSHGILKKRYVSTTLAYKALDEAFKDYRGRVKEAVGEEKELHFFNGTHEGGEDTYIDENGETHTEKISVKDHDKKYSPYEFDFNAHTAPGNWEGNSDYNLMFIRGIENYYNDLLYARGHVFVNEVLDSLGIKRTPEGAVTGWLLGSGGDDFIDFGISHYYTDEYCDTNNGCIPNIHMNFNVDGLIWNKI